MPIGWDYHVREGAKILRHIKEDEERKRQEELEEAHYRQIRAENYPLISALINRLKLDPRNADHLNFWHQDLETFNWGKKTQPPFAMTTRIPWRIERLMRFAGDYLYGDFVEMISHGWLTYPQFVGQLDEIRHTPKPTVCHASLFKRTSKPREIYSVERITTFTPKHRS